MLQRWVLVLSTLFFSVQVHGARVEYYYKVQPDDVVSEVLHSFGLKPIYGPTGTLDRLEAANPKLANLNHIFPGQKIYFSEELVRLAKSRDRVEIAADGQILPKPESLPLRDIAVESAPLAEGPVAPTVVTESVKPKDDEEKVVHGADVFATYKYTTLKAVDAVTSSTAQILSNRDVEVGATWSQNWGGFSTSQTFAVRNVTFEPTVNSSKVLGTSEKSATRLGFGLSHFVTEKLALKYSVDYSEELFVRASNSTTVVVDSTVIPSASVGARYEAYTRNGTTLGLNAQFRYLLPTDAPGYSIYSGQKYSAGIFLRKTLATKALEAGFGYSQRNQDTSLVRQTDSGGYGYLLLFLPIFGDAP